MRPGDPRFLAVPVLIAGAWVTLLVADATGAASALHHHALIEGGPPLPIAVPLFLVGWVVMVAAMMLPASLPTIRMVEAASSWLTRPRRARAAFLASFALVWIAFGLVAFLGDVGLHRVVDATPALAARPWLIEAAILALAGAYQLVPLKRRSLAACRHPAEPEVRASLLERWRQPTRTQPRTRLPRQLVGADAPDVRRGFREPRWMAALPALWPTRRSVDTAGACRPRSASSSWLVALSLSGPLPAGA